MTGSGSREYVTPAPYLVDMGIDLTNGIVRIDRFETADPAVVGLVGSVERQAERERLFADALSTGARGLMSMGLGVRVEDLEARLRSGAEAAAAETLGQLEAAVLRAAKCLEAGIDLGRSDSHSTLFLDELHSLLGPDGRLLAGLRAALDPLGNSPLAVAFAGVKAELAHLRDDIVRNQGREEEALRGTAKGIDFEGRLDGTLRQIARGLGAVVEYTGRSAGNLSSMAVVGDYLLALPGGRKIVIEVKNQQSITLHGKSGILAELDRAMTNRSAEAGLCISASNAYPAEVGAFNVYGKRVLVVDDGEGTMITAALRWLMQPDATDSPDDALDIAAIKESLERLRGTCQRFATSRSALTEVNKSVTKVSESLREMRDEVLNIVDDLIRSIRRADPGERVVGPDQALHHQALPHEALGDRVLRAG